MKLVNLTRKNKSPKEEKTLKSTIFRESARLTNTYTMICRVSIERLVERGTLF
jgi:hypothetical protein